MSRFGVGDAVFGTVAPRFGAHAEYVCLPEHGAVAPMPSSLVEKSELVAVIGARYPLERIAEAHARVDVGNIVVAMA